MYMHHVYSATYKFMYYGIVEKINACFSLTAEIYTSDIKKYNCQLITR